MAGDFLTNDYPDYQGQLTEYLSLDEQDARHVDAHEVLPDHIANALPHDLYLHQARGLNELNAGNDICVTTSTSSGKTLIYALHIAAQKHKNPDSTALLLYPNKALSRDQKHELDTLYTNLGLNIEVAVYDGDTPQEDKKRIKNEADVIITNYPGLNYYLPHHRGWTHAFKNLNTIVIDEAHTYTGTEGIHAAWITRRLLRILATPHYKSNPQLILTSATIGNPYEHANTLTGREPTLINEDGSPHGTREIALWNPPTYTDTDGTTQRTSPYTEASRLTAHVTTLNAQTLTFVPSRKLTEQVAKQTKKHLEETYNRTDIKIEPYHAGHTNEDRRHIEQGLKNNTIDAVITTNALEVGIDVGSVDATIHAGYPGTRMSLWQQLGRAGRRKSGSLAILIARNDAIDQYILNNPKYLLEDKMENAVTDLTNQYIAEKHLLTAANEHPLTTKDIHYLTPELNTLTHPLIRDNQLTGTLETGLKYTGNTDRPETKANIYGNTNKTYTLTIHDHDHTYELPEVTQQRAYRDLHPGAIYTHKGNTYRVTDFNDNGHTGTIELTPTNANYTTQTSKNTEITNITSHEHTELLPGLTLHKGTGTINDHYPTYTKQYGNNDHETGFTTSLSKPITITTDLIWLELTKPLQKTLEGPHGTLHTIEHSLTKLAPTELTVEQNDINGTTTPRHPHTNTYTTFIYDTTNGGLGFSHQLYTEITQLAHATQTLIKNCPCDTPHGCPACIMDTNCPDNNQPLNKNETLTLLNKLTTPKK